MRFIDMMGILAGHEEASITFTKEGVTIRAYSTIDGQRIRLYENTTGTLEGGLMEAVITFSQQKGA
jgi:hypothetical protein